MRYESAELCKIAINCFLVSSVSTANTLAGICERIGADWAEIVPALRLDRRIGPHAYLQPGLGIAGGNLERDLVTVQRLAAEYGSDARVVTAWQQNSAYCRDWVLRRLSHLGLLAGSAGSVLGLWGLAYKADTHSTKNSPAMALLQATAGCRWQAYDPAATIQALEYPCVRVCGSPMEAARDAAALAIMTPWREFREVPLVSVRDVTRGRDILDPYAALDSSQCRELGIRYHRLGAGES
jgi:UDPglucose 6-dehydrogenase